MSEDHSVRTSGDDCGSCAYFHIHAALFAGASWKAVTALGEWTDGEASEILWDDPIMNLRAGVRRIEADWEVWISDTHAKHGDLEAGLRKAQRVLSKAHSDDAGTGGSMPYARALCAALLFAAVATAQDQAEPAAPAGSWSTSTTPALKVSEFFFNNWST